MMKELEENKKESLNLRYLKDFDISLLNEKQQEILRAATSYQIDLSNPIRLDIDKGVIVDENNDIFRIEKNNGEFTIIGDRAEEKGDIEKEDVKQPRTLKKSLTPSNNTIYSENN